MNKYRKHINMNKHYIKSTLTVLFLSVSFALYSQPGTVAINVNGLSSANHAILDLSDASNAHLGFLLTKVSLVSTTDVATISGPAVGLIVWNTNAAMAGGLGVGFYYWSGTAWLFIMNNSIGSTITGGGTSGYIARWTSPSNISTGVAQDNGTGVSISSTVLTPVNKLDVNGNAAFGAYAGTAAPANGIIVSGQVGIGTNAPNASAVLDVTSTTQGLLFPRLTAAQITALGTPTTGLTVLNSTTNCMQYYNGAAWQNLSCPCSIATPGAITGNTSPGLNSTGTYSIAAVGGATSYTWSVSTSNGVIISGQGTTSVTIAFSGTAGTMNICVAANAGFCTGGQSCLSVTSSACGTITLDGTGYVMSTTTTDVFNINTAVTGELIVVGVDECCGTNSAVVSATNCGAATFLGFFNGVDGTVAMYCMTPTTAGAHTISITWNASSTTYCEGYAASFKGFCGSPSSANVLVGTGATGAPGSPTLTGNVTPPVANSYILANYYDYNCGSGTQPVSWTGGVNMLVGSNFQPGCCSGWNGALGGIAVASTANVTVTATKAAGGCDYDALMVLDIHN